jgi:hypothetical protein
MDARTPYFANLGARHFGTAKLGNKSRTKRLVKLADKMIASPAGTLPMKLKRPADLRAFYRIVNQKKVTHDAALKPHREQTLELMRASTETVLILHDGTELDYDGLKTVRDELGQIGNGSRRGFLCHNSLAIIAGTEDVLGLANQILYCRPEVDPKETREQRRAKKDRESRLWKEASQRIGLPPEGRLWVDICDRGSDSFEYLDHKHRQGGSYVIRCKHNRWVDAVVEPGKVERRKLHEFARALPEVTRRTVTVQPQNGQPGREATVRVGFGEIRVPAPKNPRGEHGSDPLTVWVVYVGEIDPPANVKEPVEWILLSREPAHTLAEAEERIDWYSSRWVIEDYHKGQKTGCGIETLQFTTKAALEPTIAVLSVVAVILLQLRSVSREPEAKETPATEFVPESFVRILSAWRWGEVRMDMTVFDYFYALARLGGHQNRKCDGMPGWIVLWRGWTQLHAMVLGAQLDRPPKLGQT